MLRLSAPFGRLARWDETLCLRANRAAQYRAVCVLLRLVSRLGDGVFWYGLMLALLAAHGRAAVVPVSQMIATGALGVVIYKWLKGRTSRLRPYQINPDICAAAAPLDQFSFPSGHTLHAVGFSVVALEHFPALGWILVPFAVLVAISRPVLGLHYPSDVLAGAALGAGLATLVLELARIL